MKKVVFNYAELKAAMIAQGIEAAFLGPCIGMRADAFDKVLENGLPFKMKDIQAMCAILQIRHEDVRRYFFTTKFD